MMLKLAVRSLFAHPVRSAVLACGFGLGVSVMATLLGVGISWNTLEYEALNQDFNTRGKKMDEQIGVLRRLWTEPFVTFVRVPKSTTVNVNQIMPALTTDNAFSNLKIPGLFGTPTSPSADLLVITFRRHKSVIGSGNGSLGDALLILHERIFYQGATTTGTLDTDFRQVYPCLITGGPVAATGSTPGRPCIASRKVYNIFNSPNPKAQWLGTHEWIIHANDNGGYRVQPGA